MKERERKLLRYIELSARDSSYGCDEDCQKEREALLKELGCSNEQAIKEGKILVEELL